MNIERVTYRVLGSSGRLYVPMGEYYTEEQAYRQIVKAGEKTNRQFQVYKVTTKEELHKQLTAKEARRLIGGE